MGERQRMFKGTGINRGLHNLRGTGTGISAGKTQRVLFTAKLKSLKLIMKSLGHTYIDVLKMDIEGNIIIDNYDYLPR
jgi:hypothetical protein